MSHTYLRFWEVSVGQIFATPAPNASTGVTQIVTDWWNPWLKAGKMTFGVGHVTPISTSKLNNARSFLA